MGKHRQNIIKCCKTEAILPKTKNKLYNTEFRLQLCRKVLNRTNYVKYLGIKIDKNLKWKIHVYNLASKLNRANLVLSKLKHFVNSEIVRSVYFAYFSLM